MSSSPSQNPTQEAARQTLHRSPMGASRPRHVGESPQARERRADRDRQRKIAKREAKTAERQGTDLALAEELKLLVKKFPKRSSELYELVSRLQKEAARSPYECLKLVMRAIKYEGCFTVEDINDQTKIPRHNIDQILTDLVGEGVAEWVPRRSGGPGKDGPQEMIIRLTGRPLGDLVV